MQEGGRIPSSQRNTRMMKITDTIVLEDREVHERFVRATGARGQNVNKEATAVELRVDIGRSSLPSDVKKRLMALAGRQVTTAGVLVIVSRALRSQADNRKAARARLVALLKRAARAPKVRKGTKPGQAVREDRLTRSIAKARSNVQGADETTVRDAAYRRHEPCRSKGQAPHYKGSSHAIGRTTPGVLRG